jgi:hypothetical protein
MRNIYNEPENLSLIKKLKAELKLLRKKYKDNIGTPV